MRFSVQCLVVALWQLNIAPALSGTPASGASATPFVLVQKLYVSVSAPSTIEKVIKSGLLRRLRQFNDVEIEEDIGSADQAVYVIAVEQTNLEPSGYAISLVHADHESLGILRLLAQTFAKTQEEKSEERAGAIPWQSPGEWMPRVSPDSCGITIILEPSGTTQSRFVNLRLAKPESCGFAISWISRS